MVYFFQPAVEITTSNTKYKRKGVMVMGDVLGGEICFVGVEDLLFDKRNAPPRIR